jgi:hypothetical protein
MDSPCGTWGTTRKQLLLGHMLVKEQYRSKESLSQQYRLLRESVGLRKEHKTDNLKDKSQDSAPTHARRERMCILQK